MMRVLSLNHCAIINASLATDVHIERNEGSRLIQTTTTTVMIDLIVHAH